MNQLILKGAIYYLLFLGSLLFGALFFILTIKYFNVQFSKKETHYFKRIDELSLRKDFLCEAINFLSHIKNFNFFHDQKIYYLLSYLSHNQLIGLSYRLYEIRNLQNRRIVEKYLTQFFKKPYYPKNFNLKPQKAEEELSIKG